MAKVEKRERGRPAQPYPRIPDTFENVIKSLVAPVNKTDRQDAPSKKR